MLLHINSEKKSQNFVINLVGISVDCIAFLLYNIFAIMKKIYFEIPKQKYFIAKVDLIQMFIKTFQEIDTGWRSVNYSYKGWFCLR